MKREIIKGRAREIRADEFPIRQWTADPEHVKAIRQGMLQGRKIAPPLVWKDPEGKLALLDGRHRLEAMNAQTPDGLFEMEAVTCTREEALRIAIEARNIGSMPLEKAERENAAWLMVLTQGQRKGRNYFTVPEVARATSISARTVNNMRKRRDELEAAGTEITGNWKRDRMDRTGMHKPMTDKEMEALTAEVEETFKAVLLSYRKKDDFAVCCGVANAMGQKLLKYFLDVNSTTPDDMATLDAKWADDPDHEDDAGDF